MDVAPQIINGRTIAPIALIGVSLGAESNWNEKNRIVTLKKENILISLQIDNQIGTINNEIVSLDVPPRIINGRTMVPISFIAKAFGADIHWDGTSKTVYIDSHSSLVPERYLVNRVVDGDTIEIIYKGKKDKVRLIGIDTPESVHPDATKNIEFGKIATEFTKEALENKEISLEFDISERDRYNRLLAYVWIDGKMFNKTLLESGMANVSTYPPDVKYAEDFLKLQKEARDNKIGLWADTNQ